MNMNEEFGLPWHADGKLLYTENNDFIGEMEHSEDAQFVCTSVNGNLLTGADAAPLLSSNAYLRRERDRLRSVLEEVCSRVSVALNCPKQEYGARIEIELLVHDLIGIKQCASAAIGEGGK